MPDDQPRIRWVEPDEATGEMAEIHAARGPA